jgi:hypothetical protein
MALAFTCVMVSPAAALPIMLQRGTDVHLVFDSPLSSRHSEPGDVIRFHVETPVIVDGRTVIAAGTRVRGIVEKVNKPERYGINASIRLDMRSIRTTTGARVPLEPKLRGRLVSGKTGEAAAATAGGAILLGPVGLIGGLFIKGRQIEAHPGDKATVQIGRDTTLHMH